MDTQKIRELLDKRDRIDEEIYAVVTGKEKKGLKCSVCSSTEHTARTCPGREKHNG